MIVYSQKWVTSIQVFGIVKLGNLTENTKEAVELYKSLVSKATSLDPECNSHGHRLHYLQAEQGIKSLESNDTIEEIVQLGKTKVAIYLKENTTFENLLKTRIQPAYEKILCQCDQDWTGAYCDIPVRKQKWYSMMENSMFQDNVKDLMEKEEDFDVLNFEKFNKLTFQLKERSSLHHFEKSRFVGVANEYTRKEDQGELDWEDEKDESFTKPKTSDQTDKKLSFLKSIFMA